MPVFGMLRLSKENMANLIVTAHKHPGSRKASVTMVHNPIMQYGFGGSFHENNTSCLGPVQTPNLIDELSPAKERRLNQFGTAVSIRCGNVVKFDKVCRIIRHWSGN